MTFEKVLGPPPVVDWPARASVETWSADFPSEAAFLRPAASLSLRMPGEPTPLARKFFLSPVTVSSCPPVCGRQFVETFPRGIFCCEMNAESSDPPFPWCDDIKGESSPTSAGSEESLGEEKLDSDSEPDVASADDDDDDDNDDDRDNPGEADDGAGAVLSRESARPLVPRPLVLSPGRGAGDESGDSLACADEFLSACCTGVLWATRPVVEFSPFIAVVTGVCFSSFAESVWVLASASGRACLSSDCTLSVKRPQCSCQWRRLNLL